MDRFILLSFSFSKKKERKKEKWFKRENSSGDRLLLRYAVGGRYTDANSLEDGLFHSWRVGYSRLDRCHILYVRLNAHYYMPSLFLSSVRFLLLSASVHFRVFTFLQTHEEQEGKKKTNAITEETFQQLRSYGSARVVVIFKSSLSLWFCFVSAYCEGKTNYFFPFLVWLICALEIKRFIC